MVVLVLTYHEITRDPRVFKQARALERAGHDVYVMCRQLKGYPKYEQRGNIRIQRFMCYSPLNHSVSDLRRFGFLRRAMPLVQDRFGPYLDAALQLRQLQGAQDWMAREQDADPALAPTYARLKAAHETQRKATRKLSRNLFQAEGVLYAINMLAEKRPCTPDVIHAHDIYTLPAAVLLAQETGAKILYDAHEYEPDRATKMPPEGAALADALERDCLDHVDRMTTVGTMLGQLYAKRFDGPAPDIIFNAPDLDPKALPDPTGPSLRDRMGLDTHTPLVIYTGGSQREKRGLDKVAAALVHLPRFHLAILGPRVRSDDAWLMDQLHNAGVADRVTLLDPVPSDQVVPMMRGADVAILPLQDCGISYRYCMPNKLFEAAFAELPIAAANLPEMQSFIEKFGIGRTMDATDPADIARVLRHLYKNRSNYMLTPEQRARLVADYSWSAQAHKLCDIVASLTHAPHAPAK